MSESRDDLPEALRDIPVPEEESTGSSEAGASESAGGGDAVSKGPPAWRGWVLFVLTLAVTVGVVLIGISVLERLEEARRAAPRPDLHPLEVDSARWGKHFPREYETYLKQRDDTTTTKYGGSVPRDYLEETPANVILFAGYGIAKDYTQARGHVYAVVDVTETERSGPKTAGTCWTCKSTDVVRLMDEIGPAAFYAKTFGELSDEIEHPIGCLDCHDPSTMRLRISRPALREALQNEGRDPDDISHQEMRSLVCAQCHVEYYFKGEDDYLVFPWHEGTTPDAMNEYYDRVEHTDWTHVISGTPIIKMQHPDYEVWRTGIHAYRNISCADCHMPYRTEGGVKFTNHHVQSPLLAINNACVTCHRWSEEEIRQRVYGTQDKIRAARDRAEGMLAKAHFDVAAAMQAGADGKELESARALIRRGQLRWDYVASSNGMGFHSPAYCLEILADAIDHAGQARVEAARVLARHGMTDAIVYPDFSTKEKAQALAARFANGNPPSLLKGEE